MIRRAAVALLAVGSPALAFFACANDDASNADLGAEASVLPSSSDATSDVSAATDAACDGCSAPASAFTLATLPIDSRFNLFGIWGSSKNDVWAVGVGGTVVHFDGKGWSATPSDADQALYAVWGRSADDVWAVSNAGLVIHRAPPGDGGAPAWRRVPVIDDANRWRMFTIWGTGTQALYIAGTGQNPELYQSVIAQRRALADGGAVWEQPLGCLYCSVAYGIWGTGPNDLWLVGESGQAQHSRGPDDAGAPRWDAVQTYTQRRLTAVWGTASDDVWAVGAGGTIRHWTNDATQRWIVVPSPTTENLNAVWGTGPSDIWAAGDAATVLHYDGKAWTRRPTALAKPNDEAPLYGIWGSAPDDVWFVGTGVVLHAGKGTGQ